MKGLTLNLKPDIDHPYANRDCYNQLSPAPNGNASSAHEQISMPWGRCSYRERRRGRTCGVRSGEKPQLRPGTQRTMTKEEKEEKKRTEKRSFLRLAALGGGRMLTNWKIRTWGLSCVRARAHIKQIEDSIYLAIVSARRVHTEQAKYQSQESGHACN